MIGRPGVRLRPVSLGLFMGFAVLATRSGAVTLTNLDTEPFTWTVTERGERAELTVGAGQTVEFCTDGCFVIGPSGERSALIGNAFGNQGWPCSDNIELVWCTFGCSFGSRRKL